MYSRQDFMEFSDNKVFSKRFKKTLYFARAPSTERPSLPLTELAVNYYQDACPREFGKVDLSYASFVSRRACMSPCSMMLGMIYIKRLRNKNPEYLQQISSSDLFLISVMMASKYMYDEGVDEEVFNDEWAESAKIDLNEINTLERDFLGAMDWQLFVQPKEFSDIVLTVEKLIAWEQAIERGGSFTYGELDVLTADLNYCALVSCIFDELSKFLAMCSVAYIFSVLTLLGSTAFVTTVRDTIISTQVKVHEPCAANQPVPEVVIDDNRKDESRLPSIDISSLAKQGYIDIDSKLLTNVKNDLILFKGIDKRVNIKSPSVCPNCKLKMPTFVRPNHSCEISDSDDCNRLPVSIPSYNCQIGYCANVIGHSCINVTNNVIDPNKYSGTGNHVNPGVFCCCAESIGIYGSKTLQNVVLQTNIPLA